MFFYLRMGENIKIIKILNIKVELFGKYGIKFIKDFKYMKFKY